MYDVCSHVILIKEASVRVNIGPCILYEFLQLGLTKPLGSDMVLFQIIVHTSAVDAYCIAKIYFA